MQNQVSPGEEFLTAIFTAQTSLAEYERAGVLSLIKTADPYVKRVFFPQEQGNGLGMECLCVCRELSVKYTAYIIAVSNRRTDFAARIKTADYGGIRNWIAAAGTFVGEQIYGQYLKAHLSIPNDPVKRQEYFRQIVNDVTTVSYTRITEEVRACNSPAPAQLVIEGLKTLNCPAYMQVLLSWQSTDFFSQTFKGLDLLQLLQRYPWLMEYNADVLSSDLAPVIDDRIASAPDLVSEWIKSPRGPSSYGLLTDEKWFTNGLTG